MTDTEILQKAIEEVETQTWGITKAFFEIHDIIREDGIPKLGRIDSDRSDGEAIAHFPVKSEKFHLAMFIRPDPAQSRSAGCKSDELFNCVVIT